MLFICKLKPELNVQTDSIRPKVFFRFDLDLDVNFSASLLKYLLYKIFFTLDNGVMTTPKRRVLNLLFSEIKRMGKKLDKFKNVGY